MNVGLILEAAANSTRNAVPAAPAQLAPASPANSTALAGVIPAIQGFANGFATNLSVVTLTMDNAAVDIGKAAVVFLIIAGVILWFTRVNKRLGKELVEGGVFIGIFIEFVVPFLMSIHY
jgi:hypothetical protein